MLNDNFKEGFKNGYHDWHTTDLNKACDPNYMAGHAWGELMNDDDDDDREESSVNITPVNSEENSIIFTAVKLAFMICFIIGVIVLGIYVISTHDWSSWSTLFS